MFCQGSSMSAFWYSLFDNGTNYCNLYNVMEGRWSSCVNGEPSLPEDCESFFVSCLCRKWTHQSSGLHRVHQRVALPWIWTLCLQMMVKPEMCVLSWFNTCHANKENGLTWKKLCLSWQTSLFIILFWINAIISVLSITISLLMGHMEYNNKNMWSWPVMIKCNYILFVY